MNSNWEDPASGWSPVLSVPAGQPPYGSLSLSKTLSAHEGTSLGVLAPEGLESLTEPRILLIDIETSPHLAYVWDVWQQNINPQMILENKEVLCFAAKWLGPKNKIMFFSQYHHGQQEMLLNLHRLLDTADVVIDYNGSRFDILHINTDLIIAGFLPPSPYKHIDVYRTVKRKFNFTYRSLNHVCEKLGITQKLESPTFKTWLGCIQNNPEAWDRMYTYNCGDIPPLEELYIRLRPWISNHPNLAVYGEDRKCPKCLNTSIQFRGWAYTNAGKFRQVMCNNCGSWSKIPHRESTVDIRTVTE